MYYVGFSLTSIAHIMWAHLCRKITQSAEDHHYSAAESVVVSFPSLAPKALYIKLWSYFSYRVFNSKAD